MKPFIFLILILASLKGIGQSVDLGLWNTMSLEKEFSKKTGAFIECEMRLRDNISRMNLINSNIGFSYKPIKKLKISLTYRLISKYQKTGIFNQRHRFMLDLQSGMKLTDKFSFSYRSRIQTEWRDVFTSELGKIPEWYWRNKFEFKYDLKKIRPYTGTEFRFQIYDPRKPQNNREWHRVRVFAGTDFKVRKNLTLGIYYLRQFEFNLAETQNLHILGIQAGLTLK